MRNLGVAALAAVVVQGILGGVTILKSLPPAVSTAHAALAQAFFCIAAAMALFSSRDWVGDEQSKQQESRSPSLRTLAWTSVVLLYLQLLLGSMFRHGGMTLVPHLLVALAITVVVLWTTLRTMTRHASVTQLLRPAGLLLALLIVQLGLGFAAYLTRVVWEPSSGKATAALIAATVGHVSLGALLLATALVLAIQTTRHLVRARPEPAAGKQKAATA
jgi:heme A synthase